MGRAWEELAAKCAVGMARRLRPRAEGGPLWRLASRVAAEFATSGPETSGGDAQLAAVLEEQRRVLKELAESEARFKEVFRRVPNALAIGRTADAYMYEVNEAFERMSGYSREELIGRRSLDFSWWPTREEGEYVLGKMRDQNGYLNDEEVRFLRRDGSLAICLVSASPIIMHGEPCVVWHAVDITERRLAEQKQRELEERLQQKHNLEKLGIVAGAMAHDFNNLLVSILGNADMLLLALPEGSPLRACAQAIVTSAQRASEHTRELLDYAGRGGGKLKKLALEPLLSEIVELARPLVPAQAQLSWEVRAEGRVSIMGDSGQLTRMVINLIKNAAEALSETGGTITLTLEADDTTARIIIRDNGHGMDEAVSKRMFDPFFSTKFKGRGLGLVSVPSIVERHGGKVEVESRVGVGTAITLSLPRQPNEDVANQNEPSRRKKHAGRVLVVDDESQVRSTASAMLAQLGFEAVSVESGEAAVERIARRGEKYSWILLDATMPGLDGLQVLENIRAYEPNVPVLLCSGYSHTDFTPLVSSQTNVSFLPKPYRIDELAAAVDALLA